MMMVWPPSGLRIASARSRATLSVGPPAANGTTIVTGLSGYSARAGPASAARARAKRVRKVVFMVALHAAVRSRDCRRPPWPRASVEPPTSAARRSASALSPAGRRSSITLPSLGRLPGATSATSPRSRVTSRIVCATCSPRPVGARAASRRAASCGRRPSSPSTTSRARADLGMAAHDLGDVRRVDEHAAHLGRLVGAAEPAADALVGAAGRAGAGEHRRQVAGAR